MLRLCHLWVAGEIFLGADSFGMLIFKIKVKVRNSSNTLQNGFLEVLAELNS